MFTDTLKALMRKLDNWKRKIKMKILATFEELSSFLKVDDEEQMLLDLGK